MLILLGLSLPATTSSASLEDFVQRLEDDAGYTVVIDAAAGHHEDLTIPGRIITAEKYGVFARVEILDYGNYGRLSQDWVAVDQQAPRPRVPIGDFTGKVLIWNQDAVLVLDFEPPNDAGTVQVVAGVFLGRRGVSFEGLSPRIILPGTGCLLSPLTGARTNDSLPRE